MRRDTSEPTESAARNAGALFLAFAVFLGLYAPVSHDWYAPLGWAIAAAGMFAVARGSAAFRNLVSPTASASWKGPFVRYHQPHPAILRAP